jgi:DIS3-like exonuclease 1
MLGPPGWEVRRAGRAAPRGRRGEAAADEAYLRFDVPCGSAACAACPLGAAPPPLPASAPHLALPDAPALRDFLDAWESPAAGGVVVAAGVARALAMRGGGGPRRAARVRALVADPRRAFHLFDNLHRLETAPAAAAAGGGGGGEALLAAAEWYCDHLGRRTPVVVVSDALAAQLGVADEGAGPAGAGGGADTELAALLGELGIGGGAAPAPAPAPAPPVLPAAASGVEVLGAAAYFRRFYADDSAIMGVVESVEASRRAAAEAAAAGRGAGAARELTAAEVDAALARGELLRGELRVSAFDRERGGVAPAGGGAPVAVLGRAAMGRAMHGDTVALRLLPRARWARLDDAGAGDDAGAAELAPPLGDFGAADEAAEGAATRGGGDGSAAPLGAAGAALAGAAVDRLRPAGEVVAVLRRLAGEVVATVTEGDERVLAARGGGAEGRREGALCAPLDRRLPLLRLRTRQLGRLVGARLVLRVDGWEPGAAYPDARLVRVLGPVGDLTAEGDAVLARAGVRWQPFAAAALAELPAVEPSGGWALAPAEAAAELAAGRRDLRAGPPLFSVDPPGCTDVDDALHARALPDGRLEVGVHIADVSRFVRPGSALDAEAAARATTVYLPGRRLDMLPPLLSEDAASLLACRDRLAVSVIWTLREGGGGGAPVVESVWLGRTLVRTVYQLEYSQAQEILDGGAGAATAAVAGGTSPDAARRVTGGAAVAPADLPAVREALGALARAGDALRAARRARGAVELGSAEVRFEPAVGGASAGGGALTPTVKAELPIMATVAEWMIFANATVAERTHAADPRGALLRRHPPPSAEALAELAALAADAGAPLDGLDLGAGAEAARRALGTALRAAVSRAPRAAAALVRAAAARAMNEAEYAPAGAAADARGGPAAGLGHYGLALPLYTHFTSPIRRYADVVAHRQLLAAVGPGGARFGGDADADATEAAPPPLAPAEVATRAAAMNDQTRAAKRAQRGAAALHLLLALAAAPRTERALVAEILPDGALRLFVPRFGAAGIARLADAAGAARPPLAGGADAGAGAGLRLEVREEGGRRVAALARTGGGADACAFRRMDEVWVEMGAEVSRAHGPALRLRLLSPGHPAAAAAAAAERAAPAPRRAGAPAAAYRPQGLGVGAPAPPTEAARPAKTLAPPAPLEAAAAPAAPAPEVGVGDLPPPPRALAAALAPPADAALAAALSALEGKAARYALRAALGDPEAERAHRWETRASACRHEAGLLRARLAGL